MEVVLEWEYAAAEAEILATLQHYYTHAQRFSRLVNGMSE